MCAFKKFVFQTEQIHGWKYTKENGGIRGHSGNTRETVTGKGQNAVEKLVRQRCSVTGSFYWSSFLTNFSFFISAIIEAYEKALAELVAEKEKLTENYEVVNEKLRQERDTHHQHLMSLENTFSDLHK